MSDIEINAEGMDRALKEMKGALDAIGGKKANKTIANAINQSLSAGCKEAARQARRAYTAPIKKLFDNIKIQRARVSNLEGLIDLYGSRGVSLIHFRAQPNESGAHPDEGVTAQIKRKGIRKPRVSDRGGSKSFVMKKAQGGFGVFVSHGLKKKVYGPGKRKGRIVKKRVYDLEMLFGASPIQALQRKEAQDQVAKKVEETFEPRLQAEIDKALAALGSR